MAQYSPLQAFVTGTNAIVDRQMERIKRMGLTPRQIELNRIWSYYCTTQYAARTVTWDGRKALTAIERDTISHSAVLPPGFYDPGGMYDEMPLSMRIPTAPYHLTRVVVHRFTGLLFASKMHPTISVAGNPELQTWVETLVKSARMWIRFALARNFGGGMGSVAMSFRFKSGKPMIDVHDSRWCTPDFIDQSTGELKALEIRYMFPRDERDPKDGILKQMWFWYRRVIDAAQDTVYKPVPVRDGDEPLWIPEHQSTHGLGECPAVWIRNTQTDEPDGDPDCHGAFPVQDAIDRLLSQADQGAVENCDPTLEVDSDELKVEALKKGSKNAIKLEKGGSAKYLEMTGSGIDSALKVAGNHKSNFLEMVQCILETAQDGGGGAMTATEIERRYSPMHERGDLFREQYGEHGIKPLIGKIVRAAVTMASGQGPPVFHESGLRIMPQVMLGTALPAGIAKFSDDLIELSWPEWVQRGASDAMAAAGAVASARSSQTLDKESAVKFLAPYFGIDDPAAALGRMNEESGASDDQMMGDLQAAGGRGGPPPGQPSGAPDPGPTPESPPPEPAPAAPPPPADVSASAGQQLNGAQIASLMAIVEKVVAKSIPYGSAVMLVRLALPWVSAEQAQELIAPAAVAPLPPESPAPSIPGKPAPGAK